MAKIFVRHLTAVQRVSSRFETQKKPDELTASVDKAKSLRKISIPILLRYMVIQVQPANFFLSVMLTRVLRW